MMLLQLLLLLLSVCVCVVSVPDYQEQGPSHLFLFLPSREVYIEVPSNCMQTQ